MFFDDQSFDQVILQTITRDISSTR